MTQPPSYDGMNAALLGSESAEDALTWVEDNGVSVVFDGSDGSYWDAANNRIVINARDNHDAAQILVHEVNHAQDDAVSNAAWNSGSRSTYVETMIDQETQGTVESIQSNVELRDASRQPSQTFPLENEYHAARNKAMEDFRTANPDATDAEVTAVGDQAGYDRVKQGFDNGEVTASTNGQTYRDYYGGSYDRAHPPARGGT